jgi:hypothetical protein
MNISKWNYMHGYSSNNYGAHSIAMAVGSLTLYFSYNTVVAFSDGADLVVSVNNWGPTTGKHLNAINSNHSTRIPRDDFEKQLGKCLKRHKLSV